MMGPSSPIEEMSCSALDLQRQDLRDIVNSIFISSVAISPAKRSVTVIAGDGGFGKKRVVAGEYSSFALANREREGVEMGLAVKCFGLQNEIGLRKQYFILLLRFSFSF